MLDAIFSTTQDVTSVSEGRCRFYQLRLRICYCDGLQAEAHLQRPRETLGSWSEGASWFCGEGEDSVNDADEFGSPQTIVEDLARPGCIARGLCRVAPALIAKEKDPPIILWLRTCCTHLKIGQIIKRSLRFYPLGLKSREKNVEKLKNMKATLRSGLRRRQFWGVWCGTLLILFLNPVFFLTPGMTINSSPGSSWMT